jgi:hypothetical protein
MKEKFSFGKIKINQKPTNLNTPGFYKVRIRTSDENIPILPFHDADSRKLLFPIGE